MVRRATGSEAFLEQTFESRVSRARENRGNPKLENHSQAAGLRLRSAAVMKHVDHDDSLCHIYIRHLLEKTGKHVEFSLWLEGQQPASEGIPPAVVIDSAWTRA